MKTGKQLIQMTKAYAVDHSIRSWWYVLSTGFLLVAAMIGSVWNFHIAAKILCSVLAGLLILRFFVIYHDQQHHAILPRSRMAELIMRIFGILALSPSSIWRSSHNHHHNHNSKLRGSHIGSFPIMTKAQFERTSKSKRFKYLFMRHPVTILFGYIFIFLFGMCVYPFFNSPRRHYDSLIAFIVHVLIAVGLVYYLGWQAWLLAQVVPHFVASAVGSYLFYAQHNFPEASFRDSAGWTYESAALESSSFMKMNAIMAWFTANIGYHHVHHLNARSPFYRLPEIVKALPELQSPKTTTLNPLDIIRCLRLKVYDVESQRLVSLRSA